MNMNGVPVVGQISGKATGSIIIGSVASKLWQLAAASGAWGIYPAGTGDGAGSFAENAEAIVMSTKIGGTTIGDLIGGSPGTLRPAVEIDSMIALDNQTRSQVSDFRVEDGGFNSYNKVQMPAQIVAVISRGGDRSKRQALLAWLNDNVESTTIYDVVTPEKVYKNMTLEGFEISRNAENGGASLIVAHCVFRAIRAAATDSSPQKTTNAMSANDVPTSPLQRVSAMAASASSAISSAFQSAKSVISGAANTVSGLWG